ncbi:hypothetical protein FQZ97_285110 [compost metagenome]
MGLVQVAGHPGQQAVEHREDAAVAGEHGEDRAVLEQHAQRDAHLGGSGVGAGVAFGDVAQLGFVDARVFARVVADVLPGQDAGQDGARPGDHEGQAPGTQPGDQPGDEDRPQGAAQRCAAVHQHGTTATLVGCEPGTVELGPGGHDRRLGDTQADAREQQHQPMVRGGAHGLEGTPGDGRAADDAAGVEAVQQQAAGNLHQCIGPEEGAEHQPFHGRCQVELRRDQRQGHRERGAVYVVDCGEQQQDQEDAPAHIGHGSGGVRRQVSRGGDRLHRSARSCDYRKAHRPGPCALRLLEAQVFTR